MGAQVSTAQKAVFYQICSVLTGGNVKFSKGKLKRFIRRLFLYFPQTSPALVCSSSFWDTVCSKLTRLARAGDMKAAKFLFWPLQIRAALKSSRGGVKEQDY